MKIDSAKLDDCVAKMDACIKSDGGPGSGPRKGGGSGPDMHGPVEKRASGVTSHAKTQETYHAAKAAGYRAKGNEAAANKHQAAASEYKTASMYPENGSFLRNAKTRAREAGE